MEVSAWMPASTRQGVHNADFLANPWDLLASERLERRKAVLKPAFAARLTYVPDDASSTPDLAQAAKGLGGDRKHQEEKEMARPGGIEPPTPGFGGQYSIH